MRCRGVFPEDRHPGPRNDLREMIAMGQAEPGHIHYVPASTLKPDIYQPMPSLAPDDIEQHGMRDPIDYTEVIGARVVLDGNNRVRIAQELGLDVPVRLVELGDEEPDHYALRVNVVRRHLDREARREVIRRQLELDPDRSDRSIAFLCRVSDKTVAAARSEFSERTSDLGRGTRIDATGRRQPATKPAHRGPAAKPRKGFIVAKDAEIAAKDADLDEYKARELLTASEAPVTCPPDSPCKALKEKDEKIAELKKRVTELQAERYGLQQQIASGLDSLQRQVEICLDLMNEEQKRAAWHKYRQQTGQEAATHA
jgi:hypothetical protein